MFQLKDKVAVVTGASRGIGRAISLALSDAGASVALRILYWLLGFPLATLVALANLLAARRVARMFFLGLMPILITLFAVFQTSLDDVIATTDGFGTYVVVDLARQLDTFESLPDTALMLLGTSDKFIFLWNRATLSNHIVPIANVARLRLCRGSPCYP